MHKVHYLKVKIETLEKAEYNPIKLLLKKNTNQIKRKESAMDYDNR